jgi:hypothetical protein
MNASPKGDGVICNKVWLVDYLTEFGVQMIKLSFLLFLLCFILEWWGMMCEMNV